MNNSDLVLVQFYCKNCGEPIEGNVWECPAKLSLTDGRVGIVTGYCPCRTWTEEECHNLVEKLNAGLI